MLNDGRLLTIDEAIAELDSMVDEDDPPELFPVPILCEADLIAQLHEWANSVYRTDSDDAHQKREGEQHRGISGPNEYQVRTWEIDPNNLADVARDMIIDNIAPSGTLEDTHSLAVETLEYLRHLADPRWVHESPPSPQARILLLGMSTREIADLERWQNPPRLRPDDVHAWSEQAPGKRLDLSTVTLALNSALAPADRFDDDEDDEVYERRWDRGVGDLWITTEARYNGSDVPIGYSGVLLTAGPDDLVAHCGHRHQSGREAVQCIREQLHKLIYGRKPGLAGWFRKG